jgi:hypothetical protein
VQAWQELKARQLAEEEAAAKVQAEQAVKWSFEDDDDEVSPPLFWTQSSRLPPLRFF